MSRLCNPKTYFRCALFTLIPDESQSQGARICEFIRIQTNNASRQIIRDGYFVCNSAGYKSGFWTNYGVTSSSAHSSVRRVSEG